MELEDSVTGWWQTWDIVITMDLGFDFRGLFSKNKKENDAERMKLKAPVSVSDRVFTEGLLSGRRQSIMEVGAAIRTGIRLGSITKDIHKSVFSLLNNFRCTLLVGMLCGQLL